MKILDEILLFTKALDHVAELLLDKPNIPFQVIDNLLSQETFFVAALEKGIVESQMSYYWKSGINEFLESVTNIWRYELFSKNHLFEHDSEGQLRYSSSFANTPNHFFDRLKSRLFTPAHIFLSLASHKKGIEYLKNIKIVEALVKKYDEPDMSTKMGVIMAWACIGSSDLGTNLLEEYRASTGYDCLKKVLSEAGKEGILQKVAFFSLSLFARSEINTDRLVSSGWVVGQRGNEEFYDQQDEQIRNVVCLPGDLAGIGNTCKNFYRSFIIL